MKNANVGYMLVCGVIVSMFGIVYFGAVNNWGNDPDYVRPIDYEGVAITYGRQLLTDSLHDPDSLQIINQRAELMVCDRRGYSLKYKYTASYRATNGFGALRKGHYTQLIYME